MKKKDLGLLVSLSVLAFLALFSEKKVLIAEGFALSRDELDQGESLYWTYCRACHLGGENGAPRTGDSRAWEKRIEQGMDTLISHALQGFRGNDAYMPAKGGHPSLTANEVALATGYMVAKSRKEK